MKLLLFALAGAFAQVESPEVGFLPGGLSLCEYKKDVVHSSARGYIAREHSTISIKNLHTIRSGDTLVLSQTFLESGYAGFGESRNGSPWAVPRIEFRREAEAEVKILGKEILVSLDGSPAARVDSLNYQEGLSDEYRAVMDAYNGVDTSYLKAFSDRRNMMILNSYSRLLAAKKASREACDSIFLNGHGYVHCLEGSRRIVSDSILVFYQYFEDTLDLLKDVGVFRSSKREYTSNAFPRYNDEFQLISHDGKDLVEAVPVQSRKRQAVGTVNYPEMLIDALGRLSDPSRSRKAFGSQAGAPARQP